MEASVQEIHRYPLRPPGFVEPLFPTDESRREIAEHLLEAPWLSRASELQEENGSAAHTAREPVLLKQDTGGKVEIVRPAARRCSWRRRHVVEVLARWREVGLWWSPNERTNRLLFRVAVAGGGVVDLALDRSGSRSGEWTLVGIVD